MYMIHINIDYIYGVPVSNDYYSHVRIEQTFEYSTKSLLMTITPAINIDNGYTKVDIGDTVMDGNYTSC